MFLSSLHECGPISSWWLPLVLTPHWSLSQGQRWRSQCPGGRQLALLRQQLRATALLPWSKSSSIRGGSKPRNPCSWWAFGNNDHTVTSILPPRIQCTGSLNLSEVDTGLPWFTNEDLTAWSKMCCATKQLLELHSLQSKKSRIMGETKNTK